MTQFSATLSGHRGCVRVLSVLWTCLLLVSVSARGQDVELERFVDGVMAVQAEEPGRMVGAAIAVVQNGRLALARGYGFADLASGRYADENTLFRIGSISKVFVWMAALQQVDAGKLKLDAPVNQTLTTLQLPRGRYSDVTLRHLMTHTAGFEDDLVGLFSPGRPIANTLGEYLADRVPERIYAPGEVTAYSNFGAGLAAHLVETVAGMQWHDYVEDRIFRPLALGSTSMRQPLAADIRERLATGYRYVEGKFEPRGFEFVLPGPAGSASSSALDMARLMIELLERRDSSTLSLGAKRLMLTRAFTTHSSLNGMTLGLYEQGPNAVGHAGDTLWFHAGMRLWPAQNLGVFVVFNSEAGGAARDRLLAAFERHYGLGDEVHDTRSQTVASGEHEGVFVSARRPQRSHLKLVSLFTAIDVASDEDHGELIVDLPGDEGERRFSGVSDSLFQAPHTGDRLAYVDVDGRLDRLYMDATPIFAYERATLMQRPDFNLAFLLVVAAATALMCVWPAGWIVSARRSMYPTVEGVATVVAVLIAGLYITFFMGFSQISDDMLRLLSRTDPTLYTLLWLPVLAAGLSLVQAGLAYMAIRLDFWWPRRRLHYAVLSVVNLALAAWCVYWRLLPVEFQAYV